MSYQDGTNTADDAARLGTQAKQAGQAAYGQAQDVAQDAKARASSLAGEAGARITTAADAQKDNLADRIEHVAQAVHRSGEQFEGQEDVMARLIERGADQLGSLAGSLRGNDLQGLLNEITGLAKRQPALFVGASMAAGFAMVRMGRLAASNANSPAPRREITPSNSNHSGRASPSGSYGAGATSPGSLSATDLANARGEA